MKAFKIVLFSIITLWMFSVLWMLSLQIKLDEVKIKQLENDKKFQVVADALYLEITEKEFRNKNGFKPDPLYGDKLPAVEYIMDAIK